MTRDEIIDWIIGRNEKGLVDDPRDPGGLTKWGVSLRWHPELGADGIRNLTLEQARRIHADESWRPTRGDTLPPPVALMMMDAAVNHDPHTAVILLQRALNVKEDGLLGPKTGQALATAWALDPSQFLQELAARRAVYYARLQSTMGYAELGWMRRLFRVYTRAAADLTA